MGAVVGDIKECVLNAETKRLLNRKTDHPIIAIACNTFTFDMIRYMVQISTGRILGHDSELVKTSRRCLMRVHGVWGTKNCSPATATSLPILFFEFTVSRVPCASALVLRESVSLSSMLHRCMRMRQCHRTLVDGNKGI